VIRIGAVTIDTSHPRAFAQYLHAGARARYVAVWNDGIRAEDEVDAFVRSFHLERKCRAVEELVEMVDVGFIHGCNWQRHLEHALPFLKKGKPVFIDKPLVGSLRDCRRLEELAADGAVILGGSAVRYAAEISSFLAAPLAERGDTLSVFGTVGQDEFNYAIHIVEAIGRLMPGAALSNMCVGRSVSEQTGTTCETFFVRFDDGTSAVYNSFQGAWQPFDLEIMTSRTTHRFRIDTAQVYKELLDRVCDFIETGRGDLAPVAKMTESVKVMLAGRISREKRGTEIRLADIPEGDPGFDGYVFERRYAAGLEKIYSG
jgi:hypothetical protein